MFDEQVCNQYPNEQCVTFKNLLVKTVQRHFGPVSWLPATYDLSTQAAQLVADYRARYISPFLEGIKEHYSLASSLHLIARKLARTTTGLSSRGTWAAPRYDRHATAPCMCTFH